MNSTNNETSKWIPTELIPYVVLNILGMLIGVFGEKELFHFNLIGALFFFLKKT